MASLYKDEQLVVHVIHTDRNILIAPKQFPLYTVLILEGGVVDFKADFGTFTVKSPCIIFSTPFQSIQLKGQLKNMRMLQFHGDYYCIEYHRKEVACNGILFNNVYSNPTIALKPESMDFFLRVLDDLEAELSASKPFDSIIITLIQLLLAKATGIRLKRVVHDLTRDEKMDLFRDMIDNHFTSQRKPAYYAKLLNLSPNSLTKRCKHYFMKTPSELISERVVLEAKKRLHLSRQSVKAIAHALKFEDEHYFSRFFKKVTKVSPQTFRKKTGISIVADLSITNPE